MNHKCLEKIHNDNYKYFNDAFVALEKERDQLFSFLRNFGVLSFKIPAYVELDLVGDVNKLNRLGDHLNDKNSFLLFRGQPDSSFHLIPSLYRGLDGKKMQQEIRYVTAFLQGDQYRSFREKADLKNISLISVSPREEILRWQYGQHYELWTGYLDWTSDFYVALYFANKDIPKDTLKASIFIINQRAIRILQMLMKLKDAEEGIRNNTIKLSDEDMDKINLQDFDDFLIKKEKEDLAFFVRLKPNFHLSHFPAFYIPDYLTNLRAQAQQGRFTNLLTHFSLEEWCHHFIPFMDGKINRKVSELPLIMKINLSVDKNNNYQSFLDEEYEINTSSLLLEDDNVPEEILQLAKECNSEISRIKKTLSESGIYPKYANTEHQKSGFSPKGFVQIG